MNSIVLSAGNFSPATGSGGLFISGGYYFEGSPGIFFGGDLEYSGFKSKIFSVDDVDFTSVAIFVKIKYLLTEKIISPYIGGGAGYSFKYFDGSYIHKKRSAITVTNSFAQGYGLFGLFGIMLKPSNNFNFFVEARYSIDLIRTELSSVEEIENYGGLYLVGGIHIPF
jgi:hypothetical protein